MRRDSEKKWRDAEKKELQQIVKYSTLDFGNNNRGSILAVPTTWKKTNDGRMIINEHLTKIELWGADSTYSLQPLTTLTKTQLWGAGIENTELWGAGIWTYVESYMKEKKV